MAQQVEHHLGKEKPSTKIIPKNKSRCYGSAGRAPPW